MAVNQQLEKTRNLREGGKAKMFKTINFILFLAMAQLPDRSHAQMTASLKSILSSRAINKTFIRGSKTDSSWRTYLGEVTGGRGGIAYYVVKEFTRFMRQ